MLRRIRVVGAVGAILRLFSVAFLVPVVISSFYDPYDTAVLGWMLPRGVLVFFFCFAATYIVGATLRLIASEDLEAELQEREAFLTVGVGWLLLTLIAMVPFMMMGVLTSPFDAFFEAMSGMTTTGATVMAMELETVSKSVMIWRALLQYVGGMGIIVLSVAILAKLTQGGMQMLQAEAPGPSVQRIAPRLAQTARILWGVYLILTLVCFTVMCLVMARYGWDAKTVVYEAFLHTLTTMSTGGFSNHTNSIAFFDDWLLEAVIITFVLISGTNYTLHYHVSRGNWRSLLKDPEWRFYMGTFTFVTLAMAAVLWWNGGAAGGSVRGAAFTTASMMTSTGYATADFDAWPAINKLLILLLMVTGGTAGSTSGGMKHVRILLLFQVVKREITRIRHPQAVVPLRLAGRVIQPATIMATVGFFFAFVAMWIICTVLLVAIDPAFTNIVDAASASIAALSNMGPALGVVGPTKHYGGLTDASKLLLSLEMWFGRLELFTAMIIFSPRTWRH